MGLPSRRQIAENWIEWEKENRQAPPWDRWGWDWCEPSCMACGYWSESWDVKCRNCNTDEPCTEKHMQSWNKADGLERCHIIPHALDGPDEPYNFVLMCKRCHEDAPDTRYPQVLYDWMSQRGGEVSGHIPFAMADIRRMAQAALDSDLTPQEIVQRIQDAMQDTSTHFGRRSSGTADYIVAQLSGKD